MWSLIKSFFRSWQALTPALFSAYPASRADLTPQESLAVSKSGRKNDRQRQILEASL